MPAIKVFLNLCRISNLPTVWTNVLAAVVLSGTPFSWPNFLIISVSLSFFYSGGMSLNDIFDAEIDRVEKPFRPLPSHRISLRTAKLFTTFLFGVALALLFLHQIKRPLVPVYFSWVLSSPMIEAIKNTP